MNEARWFYIFKVRAVHFIHFVADYAVLLAVHV
jgi:hypothetical protein